MRRGCSCWRLPLALSVLLLLTALLAGCVTGGAPGGGTAPPTASSPAPAAPPTAPAAVSPAAAPALVSPAAAASPAAGPSPAAAASPAASPAAVGAAPSGGEVVIGAIYPLTGSLAPTGQEIRQAIELAVDIINNRNRYPDLNLPLKGAEGLPNLGGAKLRVVFGDHAGSPEKGASEAERMISQDRVAALIGCYNSAITATASQAAERAGIPFLNPESTSPTLITRGFRWFFRQTPDDAMFVQNFYDFLKDMQARRGVQVRTIAIVAENTLFGTDTARYAVEGAPKYGYTIVANIAYPPTTAQVTSEVQQVKAANPDVIYQASYVNDALLFIKTYKELDVNVQALVANSAGFTEVAFQRGAGADAEGVLSREVWASDLGEKKPLVKQVNDLYKQRYGNDIGAAARTFQGVFVIADAINRAGSTEPEKIRQALLATDIPADQLILPWDGVKFDPSNGQNTLGKGIIVQFQDGAYRTVWPFDLAAAEIRWPLRKWSERR